MYQLNEKIAGLAAYAPVDNAGCVRLDANESFLAVPREVRALWKAAVDETEFHRYPDPAAEGLCRAFAGYYGVDPAHVTAGNGSDELISVIFQAFLCKGEAFATLEPDFSMYTQAGALAEARHVAIQKQRPGCAVDIDQVIETCRRERVGLLIFSNPCNPTSLVLGREDVRRLVGSVEGLVALDEAYMDFSSQSLLGEEGAFDNLIILRTCSKAVGMAALRLGFAVAGERLTGRLRAAKSPYNVNSLSQVMGQRMLEQPRLLQAALKRILDSRRELLAGLGEIAREMPGWFSLLPGETNFAALVMEDGQGVQQELLRRGVAVRYTGGLLWVTCGLPEENQAFLRAFQNIGRGWI